MTEKLTPAQKTMRYAGLGTEMAGPVVLGALLDFWIMKNAFPWFTLAGAILGPVMAFVHLMQIFKAKEK